MPPGPPLGGGWVSVLSGTYGAAAHASVGRYEVTPSGGSEPLRGRTPALVGPVDPAGRAVYPTSTSSSCPEGVVAEKRAGAGAYTLPSYQARAVPSMAVLET